MSRITLQLHHDDLQGKPVHFNQDMKELLIFNAVQKILNRFHFGLCRFLGKFLKVCTCILQSAIKPSVRIKDRPIVSMDTNRIMIKIMDKETKEVIKEFPPEKTLDMIARIWEMAGILVDEKR